MNFENITAISTGAASGMGLLFSQNIAELGGNVVMCDVNEKVLCEKVDEINAKGKGRAVGVICDVRDYSQVCAACDKAVEVFGSIDIMANFAGGYALRMLNVDRVKYHEFPDVPIDVFDWGLDVNLKGPFYFAHAALKQMRKQKSGLIINIGSITGQEGSSFGMDYPTAKAGLMFGLTKSIAQYGEKYGIRCVCVSPGPVLTREAMANMKTLLGRAAEPQEIIDLCLFIASDKGQFINGENIMIDGGRNAMGRGKIMGREFLNKNHPMLTVMLQCETPELAIGRIRNANCLGADAYGLQVESLKPEYHDPEVFKRIFSEMCGRPSYVTYYRGGKNKGKSDEELAEGLLTLAKSGATLIDVMGDMFCKHPEELTDDNEAIDKQIALINQIHELGAQVLMSSHILKFTPAERVLEVALEQKRRGADIIKIVTGAENMEQQIENLRIADLLKRELGAPYLFLSGGECSILRRLGIKLGCCMSLCVYEHDALSTRSQPLLNIMKTVRDSIDF